MSNILKTLAAGSVSGDYQISRSLRFNSADSAYLSRTPASAGNRKTWTWSGWVKRSALGSSQIPFSVDGASAGREFAFYFTGGDIFVVYEYNGSGFDFQLNTNQVFRDPSSWGHLVIAMDSSQATTANRTKIYWNGVQITSFAVETYPSLDFTTSVNDTQEHRIGRAIDSTDYYNGYLADIHFVDGQQLTPSSFGEVDSVTGVWKPIRYAGTYGTNGFHLDFSDNSSTTALGYDAAGSNDWTPNNFSVTAGAGNDSLVDSPTQTGTDTGAGGEVLGNYATFSPLWTNIPGMSNGNLDITGPDNTAMTTIGMSSGKWYFETTVTTVGAITAIGICAIPPGATNYPSFTAEGYTYLSNGYKHNNNTNYSYGPTYTSGDLIGCAYDADSGTLTFYKNGVSQGVAFSSIPSKTYYFAVYGRSSGGTNNLSCNFGQRPFAYTAPSGFKALCTTNLPEPTVVQGDDYFNTVLYTGTGSSLGVTGVGFQPDFVWIKERSGLADNGLYDAVRGVQKQLESNTTTAETTETTGLTAFGADGFTVGALAQLNTSADTYVAWNWNAGGSNATNTDGTITSTVRANTTAGISIVTYTGTGSLATVGHGLGVKPAFILTKSRSTTEGWGGYHKSLGASYGIFLELTDAAYAASNYWNNTEPTSTVFTVNVNRTNNGTMVAYCFAEVEGFSKFGSYTGNGSADGPFIFTGFRPAFVLAKESSVSGQEWTIYDSKRDTYNAVRYMLSPTFSYAESNATSTYDFLSNGFKLRSSDARENRSGSTYVYMAFAEVPFRNSLAR